MKPGVDLAEPTEFHPRIDLGRRDRRVTEHFLHDPEIGPSGK
jgi:hypothetical protein